MRIRRLGSLLCFLLFFSIVLYAQEEAIPEDAAPREITPVKTPEQERLELEIKTSSLVELAAWCRTLGLSEGGTRTDLATRLMNYFRITPSAESADDSRRIVTIESARSTEYFKIEVVDEEYARLTGDVRLSLRDKDAVHRISASQILFNRTRNIITARGGVEYIKEQEDLTETFRGENITVDLDNWSSIFLDGVSERLLESDGTTYRFSGTVISRSDEEVTVLSKASISNARNPEAFWSIDATKLWLLPGSDFAIFNAVLKVGEIPVLYIPFFYFPADEVIFHPVIGYRSREGTFVQTTTYLLGRPSVNTSNQSSLSRILGNSSDTEKVREGLFLRNTGKKTKDPNSTSLKALVDYYANLGAYFGLDLVRPRTNNLNAINLSMGIGVTRTVNQLINGNYSPFAPDYDGSSDWNRANLFSQDVPFRYRFKTDSSISGRYGNLSWNFPFYSDPYVDRDFMDRAEEMDWVNIIQQGAAALEDDSVDSSNEIQSYQWQVNGSLRPSFPQLAPYISSLSVSSITSTIAFKTLRDNDIFNNKPYSPNRFFFAPDKFTIYSISGSVVGTPFRFDTSTQSTVNTPAPVADDPLKNIGAPRSPWETEEQAAAQAKSPADTLSPPVLNQRFDMPRAGSIRTSIDYQLSPTSSSELQYNTGDMNNPKWKTYEDVDWSDVQSILSTFGGNTSVNFNMNHSDNLYSNVFTFSGSGTWRQFSYLNEEAEAYLTGGNPDKNKIDQANLQQYRQSFYTTSYAYTGTLRPLYRNPIFGQSNLQYGFRGLLAKSNFIGTGDNPEWENIFGAWEKEKIESHRFSTNIAANIMDKVQSVSLTAELPPLDAAISANSVFRVWISETSSSIRVTNPGEADRRKIMPFYTTETLRFGRIGSLVHYMVLDPELNNEFTTITTTLTLWGFRAAYTASRMTGFELREENGVVQGWFPIVAEPSLKSKDVTLSYSQNFARREIVKNRLNFSLNLNTQLFYDIQRYSNSKFNFTMGFTLGINNFLDLSLSSTSENAVIFRYFKGVPGLEEQTEKYPDGDQNNIFIDLMDSFNFGDEYKRRRSGFKMKTFNIAATHHLGDWNAVLGVTMSPYRPVGSTSYDVSTDVSFLVQWKPITEVKTDIKYEKKTDTWTVK
jgi:lipopolysaccharide assembly outer membrane protein LptD (OstA)